MAEKFKHAETPRQFSYRIIIGDYSLESKIAELNRVLDKSDEMYALLSRVKSACDLDSVPMLKLAAVLVLKFLKKDKSEVLLIEASREALMKAIENYHGECDNKAPDLILRRRYREEMFVAKTEYDSVSGRTRVRGF